MCPILSAFGGSISLMQKNTAEPSQRLNRVGAKFDEVDILPTPINHLYSDCINNDIVFMDYQKRFKTKNSKNETTLSSLMDARQAARTERSKTPTRQQDRTSQFDESLYLSKPRNKTPSRQQQSYSRNDDSPYQSGPTNITPTRQKPAYVQKDDTSYHSRPRSKTPPKKPAIFDDFTGFFDDSISEFSQNFFGDDKQGRYKETSRIDPRKPGDRSGLLSPPPARNDSRHGFEDGKYQSHMNETALTKNPQANYYSTGTKTVQKVEEKAAKPFEKIGIPEEEFDVETQRRLLEEIQRKHAENLAKRSEEEKSKQNESLARQAEEKRKYAENLARRTEEEQKKQAESLAKRTEEQKRQAEYFASNRDLLEPPQSVQNRSHIQSTVLNSTMMDPGMGPANAARNPHNVSDVLLDPPSKSNANNDEKDIDEKSKSHPFSEFLDCSLS